MKKDLAVAIIGTIILIAGLAFMLFRSNRGKEIIYVTCDSFSNQQEAQDYFIENNATQLDADKDGVACEDIAIQKQPMVKTIVSSPASLPKVSPLQSPVTVQLKGEAKVIVEQAKNSPSPSQEAAKPSPSPSASPTPRPSQSASPSPSPSCTLNILGLCI